MSHSSKVDGLAVHYHQTAKGRAGTHSDDVDAVMIRR